MFTSRGLTDEPESPRGAQRDVPLDSPRTRSELLDSRRSGQQQEASAKWAGARSPRALRMDIYRTDAVAAATSYMTKVLSGSATRDDATAAASRLDADTGPQPGVRRDPERSEYCTTTYHTACSRKMGPQRGLRDPAPGWRHESATDHDGGHPLESSAAGAASADPTPSATLSGVSHGDTRGSQQMSATLPGGRPMLSSRRRRYEKLSGTIGREVNVAGVPQPAFMPMHKSFIFRPAITTLDSYAVPVYSCFSPNHTFNPTMDDALRSKREADQSRRREEMRRLKEREVHHRVVAKEFEATVERVRQLKEEARRSQSFVAIQTEDSGARQMPATGDAGYVTSATEFSATAPAATYDPFKQAAKTPRSSVPTRPSEKLLSAAIRAAVAGGVDTASSVDAPTAGTQRSLPATAAAATQRTSPSRPRVISPSTAAAAAKQALDFKVIPRPPSAPKQRPPSAAPAPSAMTGPRATSAVPLGSSGNGMDLFAMTRLQLQTPIAPYAAAAVDGGYDAYRGGFGGVMATPPPTHSAGQRPTSAYTSKRARPLSARASSRAVVTETAWGVTDNFAGGAFALQAASSSRSRPQSARAAPRPAATTAAVPSNAAE
jgi:hypothetical protein